MNFMSYGENFRQLREETLNLKQKALAELMGCSRHHVGRVERNEAEYTYSQIKALEIVTGFSVADLLELAESTPSWLQGYLELSPANRRKIDAILNTAVNVMK